MKDGFLRTAAATPKIRVADPQYNAKQIIELMEQGESRGVKVMVFPELCLTGYTCSDLFLQASLLESVKRELKHIVEASKKLHMIAFVGLPWEHEGKLYNGITQETVALMRKLISVSDYTVPNYTEAAYLAGSEYHEEGGTEAELKDIIDELKRLGAKSIVITSAKIKGSEQKCVFGYDDKTKEYFQIDFEEIPVRFPGTGDIFSAVFMGKILAGCSLRDATERAMTTVKNMIVKNAGNADKYKGIPIETCLEEID